MPRIESKLQRRNLPRWYACIHSTRPWFHPSMITNRVLFSSRGYPRTGVGRSDYTACSTCRVRRRRRPRSRFVDVDLIVVGDGDVNEGKRRQSAFATESADTEQALERVRQPAARIDSSVGRCAPCSLASIRSRRLPYTLFAISAASRRADACLSGRIPLQLNPRAESLSDRLPRSSALCRNPVRRPHP